MYTDDVKEGEQGRAVHEQLGNRREGLEGRNGKGWIWHPTLDKIVFIKPNTKHSEYALNIKTKQCLFYYHWLECSVNVC